MRCAAVFFVIVIAAGSDIASAQRADRSPCIPYPECAGTDDPYDYFFVPEQRYAKNPTALKHLKPGRIIENRYSADLTTLPLRPIGTEVSVPNHYIKQISRPFIRPWALKHWDYIEIDVLLPDFSPRTPSNEALFFDGASLDVLFIRIGGLTTERDYRQLMHLVAIGDQMEVGAYRTTGLLEFRQPKRKDKSSVPSYFVPADQALKTLNGNPVVIRCLDGWWNGVDEAISCEVNLSLPRSLWPSPSQVHFGGTEGLGLTYRFRKKHLLDWGKIYAEVLALADGFLSDVAFAGREATQR